MLLRNDELLPKLKAQLKSQLDYVDQEMGLMPTDSLNFRPGKNKWSPLECIEHLNLVFDWYLPRIQEKVAAGTESGDGSFKAGFFGDRLVSSMSPLNDEVKNPMKTFKNMKPERSQRNKDEIIKQFRQHMTDLDLLMDRTSKYDLGLYRVTSVIGSILRFKLGDCYRFLLAHNERHILQCKKAFKVLATYQ